MSDKVFVHWFKDKQLGPNFGDELNHYLIEKLSGKKVEHVPIPSSRSRMLVRGVRSLLKGNISLMDFTNNIKACINGEYIVSIGSILGYTSGKNAVIWGTGFMRKTDPALPSSFLAVRGVKTQERLKEIGIKPPSVVGDPALLLDLVYNPKVEKKYTLGIIPHYSHYEALVGLSSDQIIVINLLDDIEKVIKEIKSCEYTISTSLHGIITSHVYNVPSLWFQISDSPLHGDTFKFEDYFSSVGISFYAPHMMPSIDIFNINEVLSLFDVFKEKSFIQIDISILQKELLAVAPFSLSKTFKS